MKLLLGLASFVIAFQVSATSLNPKKMSVWVLSDFDRTVTTPAWVTAVVLRKNTMFTDLSSHYAIEARLNPFQMTFDDLPYILEITQEEDTILRSILARNSQDYLINNTLELPPHPELKNRQKPQIIIPGIYYISYEEHFRENQTLLKDYVEAKKRVANQNFKYLFNTGFDIIKKALTTGNSRVYIHTARGQSPETFQTLFENIKKDGHLNSSVDPSEISVIPLSRPEAAEYGDVFFDRKIQIAKKAIHEIITLKKAYPKIKFHVIFIEDDISVIYKINQFFEQASKNSFLNEIPFHVFFTGSNQELRNLEVQNSKRAITYINGEKQAMTEDNFRLLGINKNKIKHLQRAITAAQEPTIKCLKAFLR